MRTSSTLFDTAILAVPNAAKDLDGPGSIQVTTVAAAWSAVSVS